MTGQAILHAIGHGERHPLTLALWRHSACQSSADGLATALMGTWRDEPWFIFTPAREFCDYSTQNMVACDAHIAQQCAAMMPRFVSDEPATPFPRTTPGSPSQHQPRSGARAALLRLTGVDLVAVRGISASLAPTIVAEVGTDMRKFPTVKPCCAWLGLAPRHDISGGTVWRSRTLTVVQPAPQALR